MTENTQATVQEQTQRSPEIDKALKEMRQLQESKQAHEEVYKDMQSRTKAFGMDFASNFTVTMSLSDMKLEDALMILEVLTKEAVKGHYMDSDKAQNATAIAETLEGMLKEISENPNLYKPEDIDLLIRKACIDIYKAVDLEEKQIKESAEIIRMTNEKRNALVNEFKSDVGKFVLDIEGQKNVQAILQNIDAVKECAENACKEIDRIYESLEKERRNLDIAKETLTNPIQNSIKTVKTIATIGACASIAVATGVTFVMHGNEQAVDLQGEANAFLQNFAQSAQALSLPLKVSAGIIVGKTVIEAVQKVKDKVDDLAGSVKEASDKSIKAAVRASAIMSDFKDSVVEIKQQSEELIQKSVAERSSSSKTLENLEQIKQDIEKKISEAETLKDEKKSPKLFNLLFQKKIVNEVKESYKGLKDEIAELKEELDNVKKEISRMDGGSGRGNGICDRVFEAFKEVLPQIAKLTNQDNVASKDISQIVQRSFEEMVGYETAQQYAMDEASQKTLDEIIEYLQENKTQELLERNGNEQENTEHNSNEHDEIDEP